MSNQEYTEEEINLRDYLKVIIKRKKLILTVLFVFIITTAILSLLVPKIYLSTSTIQNGNFGEPLIKKAETEEIIKSYDFLARIINGLGLKIGVEKLRRLIMIGNIRDTDFFWLKVRYKAKDTSLKICQAISNLYLAQGNNLYQQRVDVVNQHLKEVYGQIKMVQSAIEDIQNRLRPNHPVLERMSKGAPGLNILFLQNTLSNYQSTLSSLFNQKQDLQLTLHKAKELKLISSPVILEYATQPNIILNIILSGIIGLTFGILLAFFRDYWEENKST